MTDLWLTDLWIVDDTGVTQASLLLAGGRIAAVETPSQRGVAKSRDARVISLAGAYVVPALVNAHSHLFRERRSPFLAAPNTTVVNVALAMLNAKRALHSGIGTTRDAGAPNGLDLELRDAVDLEVVEGPRILACGRPITRKGGHFHDFGAEANGPAEVRSAVRSQLSAGADAIKVICSGGYGTPGTDRNTPTYSVDEIRAAVDEAHHAGRRVLAHATAPEAVRRALLAGVDTIEHGSTLDEHAIDLFRARNAYLVSTLSTNQRMAAFGSEWGKPAATISGAEEALRRGSLGLAQAVAAGIPIAIGDDTWGDLVTEMQLLVAAGMTPLNAIASATVGGAAALGLRQVGRVATGYRADLVVVRDDPSRSVEALRAPTFILKDGKVVFERAAFVTSP